MRRSTIIVVFTLLAAGCHQTSSAPPASPASPDTDEAEIIQEWVEFLHSDDDGKRLTAVVGLGVCGPRAKSALPSLIPLLKDHNRMIRAQTALALVYIDPAGEEILLHLSVTTRDDDADVRLKAVEALAKIGPPAEPAVDELIRLLKDTEPDVRRAAARALGSIGPAAARATPHLMFIVEEELDEPAVLAMARDALRWINQK